MSNTDPETANSEEDVQTEEGYGNVGFGAILVHPFLLTLAFLFGCIAGCEKLEIYGVMSGTGGGVSGGGFSDLNVGLTGGIAAVGNVVFWYFTTCGLLPLAASLSGAVLWATVTRIRKVRQRP